MKVGIKNKDRFAKRIKTKRLLMIAFLSLFLTPYSLIVSQNTVEQEQQFTYYWYAAKQAINAEKYDEALTLDENKAAVDAVVAPVADALAEQRAADAIIPGDTNGDGEVNTVDASYILMYLVGNVPADFVEAAADVDGNGRIDTLDATAILKKLVE